MARQQGRSTAIRDGTAGGAGRIQPENAAVRRAAARAGLPPERRKFSPHVTIARFRRPPPPAALQEYLAAHSLFRSPAAAVTSFHLLSSVLRPSGARYTTEAVFPLAGEPPSAPS